MQSNWQYAQPGAMYTTGGGAQQPVYMRAPVMYSQPQMATMYPNMASIPTVTTPPPTGTQQPLMASYLCTSPNCTIGTTTAPKTVQASKTSQPTYYYVDSNGQKSNAWSGAYMSGAGAVSPVGATQYYYPQQAAAAAYPTVVSGAANPYAYSYGAAPAQVTPTATYPTYTYQTR